jgi:hypothetical protein
MYDEERDELRNQAYGLHEYRPTNPDLAVGSTARHPDSGPSSWLRAMNQKRKSAEEALRESEPGPSINEINQEDDHEPPQD